MCQTGDVTKIDFQNCKVDWIFKITSIEKFLLYSSYILVPYQKHLTNENGYNFETFHGEKLHIQIVLYTSERFESSYHRDENNSQSSAIFWSIKHCGSVAAQFPRLSDMLL